MADLKFNNQMILQTIHEDASKTTEYFKSIKEIERKLNLPYNVLVNIYYTCSMKGGGASKKEPKKHIQKKYIPLLKKIRIYDANDMDLIDNNEEYFQKLLK